MIQTGIGRRIGKAAGARLPGESERRGASVTRTDSGPAEPVVLPASAETAGKIAMLTPRQRTVITLIAGSYSTKQVAGVLGISVKTAVSHRTTLMSKLGVHDTAALTRIAIRAGLIEP